jgi:hypothetical protein
MSKLEELKANWLAIADAEDAAASVAATGGGVYTWEAYDAACDAADAADAAYVAYKKELKKCQNLKN